MMKSLEQALTDLDSPDTRTRAAAVQELKRHPSEEARSAIVSALDDPEPWVRVAAALAVGRARIVAGEPSLIAHAAGDPVDYVRYGCVMGLQILDPTGFMPIYLRALGDSSPNVVGLACAALGKFDHPDALVALQGMMPHPSWDVRLKACASLVELKQVNDEVIACLEQLHLAPEAAEHNAQAREMNALNRETEGPDAEIVTPVTDDLLEEARLLLRKGNTDGYAS